MEPNSFCLTDQSVSKAIQDNIDIILEDGEQLCPQCNGKRSILAYNRFERKKIKVMCGACLGKGKMDWLEIITGVKDDIIPIFGSSSLSSTSSSKSSDSEMVTVLTKFKNNFGKFINV